MLVKILQLDHDYDDDAHCTSHFISQHAQLAFRALALGYCISTLISNFVYTDSTTFFTFFTNLSYIVLTVYFGVIVYLSVRYNDYTKALSDSSLRAVNVLQEIVATNALFLDIVYWTLLYRLSASELNTMQYFYCFNVHLINLIIITTEVITSKLRFFPRHLVFTLLFLVAYSVFSIVFYLLTKTWVYPILDWHSPKAPFVYAGCYALNIACFFAMYGVFRARERVAAKKRGNYVIIENVEARGSLGHIESGYGSRGSYAKISDHYIAPKPFPKLEDYIVPKFFAKPEDLAQPDPRQNFKSDAPAKSDPRRQSFAKPENFPPVSYGTVKPLGYTVQYPAIVVGSGAR